MKPAKSTVGRFWKPQSPLKRRFLTQTLLRRRTALCVHSGTSTWSHCTAKRCERSTQRLKKGNILQVNRFSEEEWGVMHETLVSLRRKEKRLPFTELEGKEALWVWWVRTLFVSSRCLYDLCTCGKARWFQWCIWRFLFSSFLHVIRRLCGSLAWARKAIHQFSSDASRPGTLRLLKSDVKVRWSRAESKVFGPMPK